MKELGVKTIKDYGYTENSILLEDLETSVNYRLGIAEDLKDGSYTIASSTIAVKAEGAGNADGATYATDATLEKAGEGKAALITSTQGGVDKKYSVTYEGSGSNEYMKNYNEGGRNYETTVIFTVSAS